MPQSLHAAIKHAAAMEVALREFLSGAITRPAFLVAFRDALDHYANVIDSKPYYPLADIVDSGRRSEEQLKLLCKQAAERLPRELLDRSTREWISVNLVTEDSFSFLNADGVSKFGDVQVLHATPIERQSFLLSAISGSLQPAPFSYENLLKKLRALSGGQLATWALCVEPDGAFASIESLWSLGETFDEPEQLAKLEQIRGDHVQWGNCYLLLLPADRKWLLVNRYNFSEFSIELHADTTVCKQVSDAIGLSRCADA